MEIHRRGHWSWTGVWGASCEGVGLLGASPASDEAVPAAWSMPRKKRLGRSGLSSALISRRRAAGAMLQDSTGSPRAPQRNIEG
ncbi:hypothetical protein NDU88_000222 [Pleurodeles waltl]|uniref:Uncharacterized protein n=1 Tax=Pleurodeles waltl TaxID=8319 RepID=A0AAV7VSU8_PLEWA|nr:hypothetical protein NDU88_000222 [Pleurodeles waltl]